MKSASGIGAWRAAGKLVWLLPILLLLIVSSFCSPARATSSEVDGGAKATPPPMQQNNARSGVITPKQDVDPGMVKRPPDNGTARMLVIPPKSAPGGSAGK